MKPVNKTTEKVYKQYSDYLEEENLNVVSEPQTRS